MISVLTLYYLSCPEPEELTFNTFKEICIANGGAYASRMKNYRVKEANLNIPPGFVFKEREQAEASLTKVKSLIVGDTICSK